MRAWKLWSGVPWNPRRASLSGGLISPLKHGLGRNRGGHDASGSAPTLKEELRRLYKLIHPDLLHNRPAQQATNQKSFQLLQEYLNAAKGGDGSKPFIYHFEFYIRRESSDESLEKVEVSLPPPQVRGQSRSELEVLPTTRRAIGQLLAACGLSSNLVGRDERISLPILFQEASELQRQSEASELNLQQQVSLISNALFVGRGVRVLFRAPVDDSHLTVQVQLLERLAKSMDGSFGVDFSGSTFVFGNCYKLDIRGHIWLNYEDNAELWTQFMHQADLVTASARRVTAKARQIEEEKVAKLMGVELVFTDDVLAVHPSYSLFLQRIGEGAAEYGAVGGGRFSDLPVQVGDVEGSFVDENIGCVIVPVTEELFSLYKFVERSGFEALGHRRNLKHTESKLENLRKHVRKKLRLRHLTFDRKLSSDQLMSACTRLSSHAPKLTIFSEGLSLCISDDYRLPSEGSGYSLHMKWNFSLDDF